MKNIFRGGAFAFVRGYAEGIVVVVLLCALAHSSIAEIQTLPWPKSITEKTAKELCPLGANGDIIATLPTGEILACVDIDRDRICKPGFSRTIRPAEAVTRKIKLEMCADAVEDGRWPDVGKCMRGAELDHVIPLSLGGAPLDETNLQLQRCDKWKGPICLEGPAADKDKREHAAWRDYCEHRGDLDRLRAQFKRDP